MNLEELYKQLIKDNVPEHRYYLHGLFGSTDDNERLGLTMYKRNENIYYEVYFKERGIASTMEVFTSESEACEFMYEKLINERDFFNIRKIEGLNGMTVNERLAASGLVQEFDEAKINNKKRAREILKLLRLDHASAEKIIG